MDVTSKQSRIIRMRDLPSKVGFQPATIYELISKGKFPKPFKLTPGGRAAGWFEKTIDDWMARQAERSQNGNTK